METFALVLDLFVVALLVPTIIFAVILNNRLGVLRKNKEELARLIAAFNEATVRAESGIPKLRKTSEETGRSLQEKMDRAQMLRDDLAFMVERADSMATRLEEAVRAGRSEARSIGPLPGGKDIESVAEARERAAAVAAAAAKGDRGFAAERPADSPRTEAPAGRGAEPSIGRRAERPANAARTSATQDSRLEMERQGQERIEQARAALAADRDGGNRPRRGPPLAAGLGNGDADARAGRDNDERSEAERELLRALQSAR